MPLLIAYALAALHVAQSAGAAAHEGRIDLPPVCGEVSGIIDGNPSMAYVREIV